MKTVLIALLSFLIFPVKSQTIELLSSLSNSKYELYDTYGFGIGCNFGIKSRLGISIRYLFESNENIYVHSKTPTVISTSIPFEDQIDYSTETSQIKNHMIGIAFMYTAIDYDYAKLLIGPDLTYNYFLGHDSYYIKKYKRNKVGVGFQIRMDITSLFIPQLGFFTCIIPNYSIGLDNQYFDWGLEEPYVGNQVFIDFQIGLTYGIK